MWAYKDNLQSCSWVTAHRHAMQDLRSHLESKTLVEQLEPISQMTTAKTPNSTQSLTSLTHRWWSRRASKWTEIMETPKFGTVWERPLVKMQLQLTVESSPPEGCWVNSVTVGCPSKAVGGVELSWAHKTSWVCCWWHGEMGPLWKQKAVNEFQMWVFYTLLHLCMGLIWL